MVLDVCRIVPRASVQGCGVNQSGGGDTQESQEGEGFRQDCHRGGKGVETVDGDLNWNVCRRFIAPSARQGHTACFNMASIRNRRVMEGSSTVANTKRSEFKAMMAHSHDPSLR